MLVIRMARTGRTKYPTYRIVAAESSRAATGRFVAGLGHYNPHTKDLVLQREEIERYLANGAQPSNSVIKLLNREGVALPQWAKLKTKAPKAVDAPAEEAPVEEASTEDVTEVTEEEASADAAPSEEAPAETEAPAEAESEERVATVAEEAASETADNTSSMETQETAASEEDQAAAAIESQDVADAVSETAPVADTPKE